MQSTKTPQADLVPTLNKGNKGFMILVSANYCPYGIKCHRKCWSITEFSQGGDYCKKNEHRAIHWHIAYNAKWTNGTTNFPFWKH